MMNNWTEDRYKEHMRSMKGEPDDTESPLQSKIVQWAHAHGYPCHAHPMSRHYVRAHTKGAGWADVTLCIPGPGSHSPKFKTPLPRVLFLELKAKKGPMREAQLEMERIMKHLGHEYYRVKTLKRFMEIVGER